MGVPLADVAAFELHHPDDWESPHPLFPIIGRDPSDPRLMKPHAHSVLAGIKATASVPNDCVLIGDSVSDIVAAKAAGVGSVGYAKPGKAEELTGAGADAVVTDMTQLARALRVVRE